VVVLCCIVYVVVYVFYPGRMIIRNYESCDATFPRVVNARFFGGVDHVVGGDEKGFGDEKN